jgi:hypothetical protein
MVRPDPLLPPCFTAWLAPFLIAFSRRTRPTVAALAVGALLAIGPRTVAACLRALGRADHLGFAAFHRVLNRNAWSGLALARTLLQMVVAVFVPSGPVASSASTARWNAAAAVASDRPATSTTRAAPRRPGRPRAAACAG